jgi:two-component system cell cycle response regulator
VGRPRALLVGGEPALHAYLVSLLEDAGFDATGAPDLDAVVYGEHGPAYEVVVIDISTSGSEATRLIHLGKVLASPSPAVVALAEDRHAAARLLDVEGGISDFVGKPFDPAELKARVRAALRAKRAHDALLLQATTDPLTGLANRRHLDMRTAAAISMARRYGRPLACIMIDLDFFKAINDRYGHAAGDLVLRETANRLRAVCRVSDIAGRYAGDEFLVVLPETDEHGAATMAERVRTALTSTPVVLDERNWAEIRASIGVAAWRAGLDTPAALYAAADKALYHAKSQGRGQIIAASAVASAA